MWLTMSSVMSVHSNEIDGGLASFHFQLVKKMYIGLTLDLAMY